MCKVKVPISDIVEIVRGRKAGALTNAVVWLEQAGDDLAGVIRSSARENMKIVKIGRGRNAQEKVISKGAAYLENDKRERKATGSYYTPDYIVKYIVEHTVGPALAEKFDKMRPLLRNAQKKRREAETVLKEAVVGVTGAPDNTALADYWRERILDQLVRLAAPAPAD